MILRKSDAGGSCVTLEPPCLIISPDRTGRNTREVKKFFSELLGSSQISKQWRGVGRGETVINALAQHERRSFQTCILEKGVSSLHIPSHPASLAFRSLGPLSSPSLRGVPMPPPRSKGSRSVPFSRLPACTRKENRFQQRR